MNKEKEEIRKDAVAKRDSMELDEIMDKSAIIKEKLFALKEFQDAQKILFYSSSSSEVRTMEMVEEAVCMGKSIVLPAIKGKETIFVEVKSSAGLQKNKEGVPEPRADNKEEVKPEELDLIVASNVAFTEDCKRLGRGWGFFDKIFAKTRARRVGLAFDIQLTDDLPMEEHDQYLDLLVTETGVYRRALVKFQ